MLKLIGRTINGFARHAGLAGGLGSSALPFSHSGRKSRKGGMYGFRCLCLG